jgi:hypothetical protein
MTTNFTTLWAELAMAYLRLQEHVLLHPSCEYQPVEDPFLAGVRSVLNAGSGNWPALTPVSVSERLPAPNELDARGMCWCSGDCGGYSDPDKRVLWTLSTIAEENEYCTHWLPAYALPAPPMSQL